MDCESKIVSLSRLADWRADIGRRGLSLVVTNGCFDILHVGHVACLESARQHGDLLLVGLNDDASVRALKGPGRPLNPQQDRAILLAALAAVSAVTLFPETDATAFLKAARPDVYVKGGDYTLDTIHQEERRLVESLGGRVLILGHLPDRSTSMAAQRIARSLSVTP